MQQKILMEALTNSEIEGVNYALVDITNKRLSYYKRMAKLAKKLNHTHGVNELIVYCDNADFYMFDEENDPTVINEENLGSVITLSDTPNLCSVEETIKYGEMKFRDSEICFTGSGKYSGDEFWCTISYKELFGW